MRNRILFLLAFCGLVASASAQSDFNRFFFKAGAGLGIGRDDVASYVGNSSQFTAGAGINFNRFHRLFGADAEYMYYGLGFRPSVIRGQSLADQKGHMQSVSLDGIVNVPRHLRKLSAYGIFGVGFYDRSVSVPKHLLLNGTPMQPAWRWWDLYWVDYNPSVGPVIQQPGPPGPPYGEYMSSNSKVAGGPNYGGGIAYPLRSSRAKLYFEWRYHRAYQSDGKTIVMPITIGLRW